tara:strand:+ start:114 stop:1298 length:1185 start_codon:yes stop_codon:yes gene_type:complete
MVDWKSKYLQMKLKYINTKHKISGGAENNLQVVQNLLPFLKQYKMKVKIEDLSSKEQLTLFLTDIVGLTDTEIEQKSSFLMSFLKKHISLFYFIDTKDKLTFITKNGLRLDGRSLDQKFLDKLWKFTGTEFITHMEMLNDEQKRSFLEIFFNQVYWKYYFDNNLLFMNLLTSLFINISTIKIVLKILLTVEFKQGDIRDLILKGYILSSNLDFNSRNKVIDLLYKNHKDEFKDLFKNFGKLLKDKFTEGFGGRIFRELANYTQENNEQKLDIKKIESTSKLVKGLNEYFNVDSLKILLKLLIESDGSDQYLFFWIVEVDKLITSSNTSNVAKVIEDEELLEKYKEIKEFNNKKGTIEKDKKCLRDEQCVSPMECNKDLGYGFTSDTGKCKYKNI